MGSGRRGRYLALICVRTLDHVLTMAGEERVNSFLFPFSYTTVTPLHDANDHNDGDACMERQIFR